MPAKVFDAIVIGAGQSGPPLVGRLCAAGMQVAIVERGRFGGTCVNTGCIPSKAFMESAKLAYKIAHAEEMGIRAGGSLYVDMRWVNQRKDRIVQAASSHLEEWLHKLPGCKIYKGHARFIDANTVRVNERELCAKKIFLDVGGRAFIPNIPGTESGEYLTNSTLLNVDYVPEDLIIVGGSYTGLEFAQMFCRFGSKVTVLEKGMRLLPHEDEDVAKTIKNILELEGITFRFGVECKALEKKAGRYIVTLEGGEGAKQLAGSHVVFASGRKPNTDDLDLEAAGVKRDASGYIQVDDELKTTVPGIWALGECNGKSAFTHASYNDYQIVAANLLDGLTRKVSDRILTYALFTDPPFARVGMNESEVLPQNIDVLVGKWPMSKIKRAEIDNSPHGFMKVLVDAKTQHILGAGMVGEHADEIIHLFTDMMYAKAPYTIIRDAMHIHPTISELIPTMLGELTPLRG